MTACCRFIAAMQKFYLFKKSNKREPSTVKVVTSVLVFASSVAGTVLVSVFGAPRIFLQLLFVAMAVSFAYIVYLIIIAVSLIRPRAVAVFEKFLFTRKMVHEYSFRTGFAVNLAYMLFNAVYGIVFRQIWNMALAAYYLILGATRGIVVYRAFAVDGNKELCYREKQLTKLRIYRCTGIMLIVLNAALTAMVWLMVHYDSAGFRYKGLLIVVASIYTVIKVVMAVYNMVKVKGMSDYCVHAVRSINLTAAIVSTLALHTALLAAASPVWTEIVGSNAVFGTGSCVLIMLIGAYMIVNSIIKQKKYRCGDNTQRELPLSDDGEFSQI